MLLEIDFTVARDFATALMLGALLGIEREKRNEREGFGIAGLRSFVLIALIGAVAGYLAKTLAMGWIFAVALLVVGLIVVAGYLAAARKKPEQLGLTTELAAIAACLLGALATTGSHVLREPAAEPLEQRDLAIGLGVLTAALLAYKQPLHAMVGKLGVDDVFAGVRFLLATFIVLPLMPDEVIDPWGALNPYRLWVLVLLISGLSLLGYIASRWLGPGRGTAVTAATGGLVSSTAVTLTFVKQSHEPKQSGDALAGGILLAWAVMLGRVVVAATLVHPPLFTSLIVPFGAMLVACAVAAWLCFARSRRGDRKADAAGDVPLKNPFSLVAAGKFALLFGAVQVLLKLAQTYLPQSGTYVVATLAGLTDVDAITLSMAEQAKAQSDATAMAVLAILLATASNTVVKAGMAASMGHRALRRPVVVGAAAVLVAGAAAQLFA